jgi:ubiquinone biosynthesis protein UbiJ
VLTGSGNALAAAVYGKSTLTGLIRSKNISVAGDVTAAQVFVGLFALEISG